MSLAAARCTACRLNGTVRLAFLADGHAIYRCDDCGHGRAQIIEGAFDPATYYQRAYFEGGRHDGYANYASSERIVRQEFRTSLERLSHFAPRGGRLLEIGCAYGFFLLEAQEHYECVGIDISADAVAVAQSRGVDARCQTFGDTSFEGSPAFDVVAMFDVIEHLERPDETLTFVGRRMRQDGMIMVTTGDFGSLAARFMGRRWRLMTPPQHLHFFTQKSLRTLLDLAGFEVVSLEKPSKVVPLSLIAYQLTRGWKPLQLPVRLASIGIPVNLFDAMHVVARKVRA